MKDLVTVFRKERFNSAHRLFNPQWTDEQNLAVFGKCSYPNYHGHNYELIVKVIGEVNEETGYVVDLKKLSDLIKSEIVERFDHKNLNLDTKEFAAVIPTAENIAKVIFQILRPKIDDDKLLQIRLYETDKNYVEYPSFLERK